MTMVAGWFEVSVAKELDHLAIIKDTDLAAYERVLKAAAVFETAKKEFDTAKKALAKVMYR